MKMNEHTDVMLRFVYGGRFKVFWVGLYKLLNYEILDSMPFFFYLRTLQIVNKDMQSNVLTKVCSLLLFS